MRTEFAESFAEVGVDVNALRARLETKAAQAPGAHRAGGPGAATSTAAAAATDQASLVEEILSEARKGIVVKPFAESRSLLALLKAAKQDLPPEFAVDAANQNYRFYWVETGFSVQLDPDQFARSAEFGLRIRDDGKTAPRRTRPIRVFPGRKDVTLFAADVAGGIGLDAKFDIVVPGGKAIPFAELDANAALKTKLVFGPLSFSFRRAAIEVVGEGEDHVLWNYRLKSELRGANEFKSILALKVPAEVTRIALDAALKVVKCKRTWLFLSEELPPAVAARTLDVELDPGAG